MKAEQVIDHFDRICDAPDAIPRLRRFILDLAVRGKLVDQDPNDEPASELLKRIQAEKARLVKMGEIRKEKPLPLLEDDDALFAPPRGWEWVRLRRITSDRGQKIPDDDFTYIDVTAINKEIGCIANMKVVSASDAPSRARKKVQKGDVIYSCVRPYLLNIALIESDIVPSPIASTAFAVLNGFGLVLSKYLWIVLRSPFMVECVEAKMRGQAYPAINDSDFARLPLPLPPFPEQRRIVAKVEELMALCDRLEASQKERERRRDELATASLHRLNNGGNADEFREHARFHLDHLPRLSTRLEHIQQLRQTILNLAVRGKLVPQDPNDEPVSELLERLVSLGSEGGKVPKPLRPLDVDALPSELPFAWVWVQAQDLCRPSSLITYGVLKPIWVDVGVPTVRVQDIQDGTILVEGVGQCSPERAAKFGKTTLEPGDLLIAKDGATLGKTAFVPPSLAGGNITQHVLRFPLTPHVASLFIRLVIDSPHGQAWMRSETKGVALPGVNVGDFRRMPIPLPPLAEQHRIVAKVDELMALVDALETQLATARTTAEKLMEAVVAELTRSGVIYAPLRNDFAGLSADQPNVLYRAEGPGAA